MTGSAASAVDFRVAEFGATGDGKTDDGAAIQKAMDAAVGAGAGSRVIFEKRRVEARSTPCIQAFSVNGLAISNNILSVKSKGFPNIEPLSLTNIVSGTIFSNLVE